MQLTAFVQPSLSAQRALSDHVVPPSRTPRTAPCMASRPLTVTSFLSPSPSPTTYIMSGAGRRCSCRAAPLRAPARPSALTPRPGPRRRPRPGRVPAGPACARAVSLFSALLAALGDKVAQDLRAGARASTGTCAMTVAASAAHDAVQVRARAGRLPEAVAEPALQRGWRRMCALGGGSGAELSLRRLARRRVTNRCARARSLLLE
jgi:hypothetical protein